MWNSSADIEALLVNFNDLDDPTPGQLPAIFRDIVERLSAHGLAYAVLGRIALTRYEQARYVSDIEIVAELGEDATERAAALVQATRERFAPFMDRGVRRNAISLVRPCSDPVEGSLITQAETCDWFGIEARIASAEHLLWLWCRSDTLDYRIDASALIGGGVVDLYRVLQLLRETDDEEETGRTRLRLAIGDAVLSSECTFSRYQEEKRKQRKPGTIPVWRLRNPADEDGLGE